jgi:precorrin-6A/cobalt-precorrin-6A reductase
VRILILGGTASARELATELRSRGEHRIIFSLAGRTDEPALPEPSGDRDIQVRIGGFGGSEGLAAYLRAESVDLLIDATHPFAQAISEHAIGAANAAGVRLLALHRPRWTPRPGDRWTHVPSVPEAARHATELPDGGCVLVTTGRSELAAYAQDARHAYVIRTVTAPTGPLPPRHVLVLDRGPYTVEGESALMERHGVCALVTKNSGGGSTEAKLAAARQRDIPVIIVDPPAPSAGIVAATTTSEILRLIQETDESVGRAAPRAGGGVRSDRA